MVGLGVEFLCLVGDAALVALFYRIYKRCQASVEHVKSAPSITCGSELDKLLQQDGSIAYACVEGSVSPVGRVLRSQYKDDVTGVVQKLLMVEHKSKRTQGFWADVKKVLRDTLNSVPFVLSLPKSPSSKVFETEHQVNVVDPLTADFLLDNLTETYDHFQPETGNLFSRGMDRLFGEVTKGIQETESMLPVGASLLGLGKVLIESTKIKLLPPDNGAPYILTPLSKTEVIKLLESRSFLYKILVSIFGAIGVAIFIIWLRRLVLEWKERRDISRQQEELEAARLERMRRSRRSSGFDPGEQADTGGAASSDNSNNSCVICLSQPRDVVLLHCGHICVCADCVQELPSPRKCPVCRARVDRIIPVYNV